MVLERRTSGRVPIIRDISLFFLHFWVSYETRRKIRQPLKNQPKSDANCPNHYIILSFGQFSAGRPPTKKKSAEIPQANSLRKIHSTPTECGSFDRPISIDITLLQSEDFSTSFLCVRNLPKNIHAFETQRPRNKDCPNFSI